MKNSQTTRVLNSAASKTVFKILSLLPDDGIFVLEGKDYNTHPLTVERLGEINTPIGQASVFSFAFYFKKGKDTFREPEIILWLIGDSIYPVCYQDDSSGVFYEAIEQVGDELKIDNTLMSHLVVVSQRLLKFIRDNYFLTLQEN